MGNILGGGGGGGGSNDLVLAMQNNGIQTLSGHGHQSSGNYGLGPELQCCEPVADLTSLLGAIGAIAGLSLFLRQAVIDSMLTGRALRHKFNFLSQGKLLV